AVDEVLDGEHAETAEHRDEQPRPQRAHDLLGAPGHAASRACAWLVDMTSARASASAVFASSSVARNPPYLTRSQPSSQASTSSRSCSGATFASARTSSLVVRSSVATR